mmetsp:Transcript_49036/g.157016  ORF Transcript_49036/g.157016 Transcript_49036/m.157016 type:complete len:146 (+) Transcript_49036:157-594(+)
MEEGGGPSVPAVAARIFEEMEEQQANSQGSAPSQVSNHHLRALHFLFEKNFAKALEIVDSGGVRQIRGERSGREFFQVQGKRKGESYFCFPLTYCSCHAYFYDVLIKNEAHCCKHQLAARVAHALRRSPVLVLEDVVVAKLLNSL